MRVCCNSGRHGIILKDNGEAIRVNEIDDPLVYFNHPQMKNIRSKLIKGERASECQNCYQIEDAGGVSIRQTFAEKWPMNFAMKSTDRSTGELTKAKIIYLDLAWSNKCNLKCKMCSPYASDQLIDESKKFQLYDISRDIALGPAIWSSEKTIELIRKCTDFDLEDILVTGGEPLINNDFYEFCKFLVAEGKSQHITLAFHSNLTVTPSKWLEIWSNFKRVVVRASIDAIGKDYEYIRYPGKWKIVEENIKEIVSFINKKGSQSNTSIEFHTVLSLFNFHAIPNLIDFLSTIEESELVRVMPYTNYIHWPESAKLNLIPLQERKKMISDIKMSIEKNKLIIKNPKSHRNITVLLALLDIAEKDILETDPDRIYKIFEKIIEIDRYRGQNTYEYMPWLSNLIPNKYTERKNNE
jgi:molybdenum cofactor biosynthesis enzyme MoaA